jgi:hypothetical protein
MDYTNKMGYEEGENLLSPPEVNYSQKDVDMPPGESRKSLT